jgi:SAM-dependent MidA family methyltransferase
MKSSNERPLAERILQEMELRPMPFRRFMEMALYDDEAGYYRRRPDGGLPDKVQGAGGERDPFGVGGDFFTNSQLQPVFGRLIAQQIARWREEMGGPADFAVLELGAGRGETTEVLRRRLPDARVEGLDYGADGLNETIPAGVVFSNEFFDALPVHSVEKRDGGIVEQFVEHYVERNVEPSGGPQGQGFRFVEGPASDPRLAEYVERYAPGLADGQRIEVNLAALEWLERIAARLGHGGYILTIDYGYTAGQIDGGRRFPSGSLMSYVEHQASDDVLATPGSRDITAHVNFTALETRGEELGLVSQGLRTQAQFLMDIGEPDQFAEALDAATEQESFRLRMQLKTLLFGLGETFEVLIQRKLEK